MLGCCGCIFCGQIPATTAYSCPICVHTVSTPTGSSGSTICSTHPTGLVRLFDSLSHCPTRAAPHSTHALALLPRCVLLCRCPFCLVRFSTIASALSWWPISNCVHATCRASAAESDAHPSGIVTERRRAERSSSLGGAVRAGAVNPVNVCDDCSCSVSCGNGEAKKDVSRGHSSRFFTGRAKRLPASSFFTQGASLLLTQFTHKIVFLLIVGPGAKAD